MIYGRFPRFYLNFYFFPSTVRLNTSREHLYVLGQNVMSLSIVRAKQTVSFSNKLFFYIFVV